MSDLNKYERAYCSCEMCKTSCRSMPGSLAPGDLERIVEFSKPKDEVKFVESHFQASEGTVAVTESGEDVIIPTIVPAQNEDGKCVFFTEEGKCSIHRVAPFGCRNFKTCVDEPEDEEKYLDQCNSILASDEYHRQWSRLRDAGALARPREERQKDYEKEIRKAME